jgi:hypothetical protein
MAKVALEKPMSNQTSNNFFKSEKGFSRRIIQKIIVNVGPTGVSRSEVEGATSSRVPSRKY